MSVPPSNNNQKVNQQQENSQNIIKKGEVKLNQNKIQIQSFENKYYEYVKKVSEDLQNKFHEQQNEALKNRFNTIINKYGQKVAEQYLLNTDYYHQHFNLMIILITVQGKQQLFTSSYKNLQRLLTVLEKNPDKNKNIIENSQKIKNQLFKLLEDLDTDFSSFCDKWNIENTLIKFDVTQDVDSKLQENIKSLISSNQKQLKEAEEILVSFDSEIQAQKKKIIKFKVIETVQLINNLKNNQIYLEFCNQKWHTGQRCGSNGQKLFNTQIDWHLLYDY